ncbi:MAG TPA: acyltransferase [Polyangiales bacterium]|nr:acyltransferase [Polyangiales bacterium]
MGLRADRRIENDWYDAPVRDGVSAHDETYLDSAFCFATVEGTVSIARGAHIYSGSLFDVGSRGHVSVGECAMLNGVYVLCDARVEIGAYATISWNVVFMDTYRMPFAPEARRAVLERRARERALQPIAEVDAQPVCLRDNVWIGFDVCVLPGVTIGEGSVVGARSVVVEDVPDYTVVAGNPARPIRSLPRPEGKVVLP